MGEHGWASDPKEATKSPGGTSVNQVLFTNLREGGSESQSKPIGILVVREPMSAGEAGSRVCPPMEPRKAKHTLSWPRGRGLGKAEGAQTPHSRPTGLQEVARRFRCRGCYSTVCDLPLDCPVQDVTVTRGQQAMFSCTVNFQLPKEEITYSWRFAGGGVSRGGAGAEDLAGG